MKKDKKLPSKTPASVSKKIEFACRIGQLIDEYKGDMTWADLIGVLETMKLTNTYDVIKAERMAQEMMDGNSGLHKTR